MRYLKILLLGLLICAVAPLYGRTVRKALGDINGDGVKEVAIEEWSGGSAGESPIIKIFSGKRLVFGPVGLSGSTADGYRSFGKQIVVWEGNWDEGDKFSPHRYDFTWYAWNEMNKEFQAVKTGRTKKSYSYNQARKIMSRLAIQRAEELVIFWEETKVEGSAVELIYRLAQKLPQNRHDKFILTEIGQLHCREREKRGRLWMKWATLKEKADLSEDAKKPPKYSVYQVNIYHEWAQVSFQGGPVEPGAEIYRKNASGRWELIAEGNEFSGWIKNGTIPKEVAKHIGIY